jgi:hypothetical protein
VDNCKLPIKDVKQHTKNILKLSEFKLDGCKRKCYLQFVGIHDDSSTAEEFNMVTYPTYSDTYNPPVMSMGLL